jgi:hypothetical protein
MRFLDRIKLKWLTRKNSSEWTDSEKRKITEIIDKRNKEIEVVRWESFPGEGQPYRYYHDNGNLRAEGFYNSLGYDKNDQLQDEKFQGKNVEYHENGQVKDVFFYNDGIPTGEYYHTILTENLFSVNQLKCETLPLTLVLPIVGLDGSTMSGSKKPIFSSGGTNNDEHLILTSSK